MKIIILGPQGSGKGSVADFLTADFQIPHISTGQLFRENMAERTSLGVEVEKNINSGILVSDDLTMDMLKERLDRPDCQDGFLLDGFPRTLNQAKLLADLTDVDCVVELDVADDIVMKRISGRYMCKACDAIHNSNLDDMEACKVCGAKEFYQREDDTEDLIIRRLKQYHENIGEILDFYREQDILASIKIESTDSPKDVYIKVRQYV